MFNKEWINQKKNTEDEKFNQEIIPIGDKWILFSKEKHNKHRNTEELKPSF